MIDVLDTYLTVVHNGHNLKDTLTTSQMLRNYAKPTTSDCLTLLTGCPITYYYDPAMLLMKRLALHPYLHEQTAQWVAWTKPKPHKEPCTYRMLAIHANLSLNAPLTLSLQISASHMQFGTVAVCLQMGGALNDKISFCLSWKVISIPTNLHECFQEIGSIMLPTLQGALKTS
jgi:hypothetical protein